MSGDVQIFGQFKIVLFGTVGDGLQQLRLDGGQWRPVGYGHTAQVTKAPFFGKCYGLAVMLGFFEPGGECCAAFGQLAGQGVDVAHTQLDELLGFIGAFPVRVLAAPDSREPVSDVDLCRA